MCWKIVHNRWGNYDKWLMSSDDAPHGERSDMSHSFLTIQVLDITLLSVGDKLIDSWVLSAWRERIKSGKSSTCGTTPHHSISSPQPDYAKELARREFCTRESAIHLEINKWTAWSRRSLSILVGMYVFYDQLILPSKSKIIRVSPADKKKLCIEIRISRWRDPLLPLWLVVLTQPA